jgi:hypothetical protein
MIETLKVSNNYNQELFADYFSDRKWPVSFVNAPDICLIQTDKGASLECGDGRFDDCPDRKKYGPRVFGGVNAIQAILTGGNLAGLHEAWKLLDRIGYTPGTHSADHGGCGYYDLWNAGKFKHAKHANEITIIDAKPGEIVKSLMKVVHGKHFRLNGYHREEAVRLNPLIHMTECARGGDRFRVDDWLLAELNVDQETRMLKMAETVEQLKPDACKLEIIRP